MAPFPSFAPLAASALRRTLDDAECRRILACTGWGVLSVVEKSGQPYAVPVSYAFDGEALYVASSPGRKLAALEANGQLCLTLVSLTDDDEWLSVVLSGHAHWVDDAAGRMKAIRTFARQPRRGAESGVRDAGRLLNARIARVEIVELAGRARG